MGGEDHGLSVVQPGGAAARRRRDDRERPERLRLTYARAPKTSWIGMHVSIRHTASSIRGTLTVERCRVIQPSKEHKAPILVPRKMRDALCALLEPLVIPAGPRRECNKSLEGIEKGVVWAHAPLRDDDAAFTPLDAGPHPPALLEVLCAGVDRVERRGLALAPVRNEAPPHGVHHERGVLRLRAADDGRVRARCDVIAGHVAVSVYPLVYAECGIAGVVELLDIVCLCIFWGERKMVRLEKGIFICKMLT